MALPSFLVKKVPKRENIQKIRSLIDDNRIHTVCESAKCPNIGECYSRNTATFMILGNVCTRSCRFCNVSRGTPEKLDPDEPKRIAAAVKKLGLHYVVITSVTRDDLPDGGASQFAKVINECRMTNAECRIEVLIPDFQGDFEALRMVLDSNPYVLNHNVETVPRLYPKIRPQAEYNRSLKLLGAAKAYRNDVYTKSGFMVGLGETREEVEALLLDLKSAGCDIVTIGQYLPPSKGHAKLERYVHPDEFEEFRQIGINLGFKQVGSGPFVRSSYQAERILNV